MMTRISIGAGAMALALMIGSGSAGAQFTSVMAPKRAAEAPPAVIAEQLRQRSDSVARQTLTDMKAWVDSAASTVAAVPKPAMQDSVTGAAGAADTALASARRTTQARSGEVAFKDGGRAPDTASPLPLVLLFGFGAVGAGLMLLRRSPQGSLQWARRVRRSARRS